ncbi:MAG: response regulator [Planctomycetes bacterium]|nr:response regulator [Planctomycetota bacterium]
MPIRPALRVALAAIAVAAASSASAQELVKAAQAAVQAAEPGSHAQRMALLDEADALIRYDVAEAATHAAALVRTAHDQGDAIVEGLASLAEARALSKTQGRDAAMAAHARAVAVMPDAAPMPEQARFAFWLSLLWHTLDRPPEFMSELRRAYDLADRAGDEAMLVHIDIVAINVLNWSEDPLVETERLRERARHSGAPSAMLASDMLLVRARQATGDLEAAAKLLSENLDTAARLGDRASQSVMMYYRASTRANDDPAAAIAMAEENLALCKQIGDRELLALANDLLAQMHLLHGDATTAMQFSEKAIAALEGMYLDGRMPDLLETAAQIAATGGDVDRARAFGGRAVEIRRQLAKNANITDRSRLWRESEQMRSEMRRSKDDYERRLAAMNNRFDRLLLWGSAGILLLVGTFAGLLLRAKRRLERGNRELENELEARARMQQEREALERNLRQLERLDSIGMLAGGFAHDFNNILVSVLGNAQMLLEDQHMAGESREMLEQVLSSSQRAAKLCRDLMQYARETSSTRQHVDLRDLVTSLLPLARVGLGGRVEVDVRLCDAPCMVEVDTSQIEQVLMNMLVNAGDAMHGSGRIDLQVLQAQLPGHPPTGNWFGEFHGAARDCVVVSIRDHGEGMDDATIRRVFDPFFSTRFAGRGLGLAASFSALRRHGGVVEIVSARGEGACFRVYLPRSTAAQVGAAAVEPTVTLPSAPRKATPARPRAQLLVLVVDDEPFVRDVARRSLERIDARVLEAADAERALQVAERHRDALSLAVLDVTMPRMDGPALARRLRELAPDLPVLFMTGHARDARHVEIANSSVVQKPFAPEALQAAVTEMLAGHGQTEVTGG